MGIQADTRDELKKERVTKIHGQPASNDLTNLEKELIAILAALPTALGGGNHGHARMIMEAVAYTTMTGRTAFTNPTNPGIYPTTLAANAVAGREQEPEQKQSIKSSSTNTKCTKEFAREPKTSSLKQSTTNTSAKLNTRHWDI
jgi:hypothetical protein